MSNTGTEGKHGVYTVVNLIWWITFFWERAESGKDSLVIWVLNLLGDASSHPRNRCASPRCRLELSMRVSGQIWFVWRAAQIFSFSSDTLKDGNRKDGLVRRAKSGLAASLDTYLTISITIMMRTTTATPMKMAIIVSWISANLTPNHEPPWHELSNLSISVTFSAFRAK